MEDERVTNKHGKNKTQISISTGGGGAVVGLLLLGGALAVTGLMAVVSFATKKNKPKCARHKPNSFHGVPQELDEGGCQTKDEATTGVRSLLQHSTTANRNACCTTCGSPTLNIGMNQINPSELVEEKLDPRTNKEEKSPTCFHQEILFSDSSPPGSAVSSNENGVGEECLTSLLNNPCFKAQEVDKSDPKEGMDNSEADKDTTSEAETEEDVDEDEDENDDDVESYDVSESGEDSSEVTGRTSLDSHEEAIWPAEFMEETERQFKGGIVDTQSQVEGTFTTKSSSYYCDSYYSSDGDADSSDYAWNDKAMTSEAKLNEKTNLFVEPNNQPSVSHSSKWRTWFILMLSLALLLLLVVSTHRTQDSHYVLDGGNSVIVP